MSSVCKVLTWDSESFDEILRLLLIHHWDVDGLINSVTGSTRDSGVISSESAYSVQHSMSYRRLSSVMSQLRCRREALEEVAVRCQCGATDSLYSLKGCNHWCCQKCWMDVILSSLPQQTPNDKAHSIPVTRLSVVCASPWQCPEVDPLSGKRCPCQMRGDFISHLCGSEGSTVRQLFYCTQLHACADKILSETPKDMDSSICCGQLTSSGTSPSASAIEIPVNTDIMSWWSTFTSKKIIRSTSTHSDSGISMGNSSNNCNWRLTSEIPIITTTGPYCDSPSMKERRQVQGQGQGQDLQLCSSTALQHPAVSAMSPTTATVDTYQRLIDASNDAETYRVETALTAESGTDIPSSIRLQLISDRWCLISAVTSLLAHSHIMLAAEVVRVDIAEMEVMAGGSIMNSSESGYLQSRAPLEGAKHFGCGWSDIRGLSFFLQTIEKLTVTFAEILVKLMINADPLNTSPQTQIFMAQIMSMTGALRNFKLKLLEYTTVSFVKKREESTDCNLTPIELGFGVAPLL